MALLDVEGTGGRAPVKTWDCTPLSCRWVLRDGAVLGLDPRTRDGYGARHGRPSRGLHIVCWRL